MRIGCLISAREKSTRLKKKLLKRLGSLTIIEYLMKRLKLINCVDDLILSTSINKKDLVLVKYALKHKINFFCGSENDKLLRYLHTALSYKLDSIIVVDADDPFCFTDVISKIAEKLKTNKYDYVSAKNLPIGASSTGIKVSALQKVISIKKEEDTEVWGGYFLKQKQFKKYLLKFPKYENSNIRLTLDYIEDFVLIKKIYKLLRYKFKFKSIDIINLFNKNKKLIDINKRAKKKYLNHLKKSAAVRF